MTPAASAVLQQETAGHELIFPAKPTASVLAKAEVDAAFGQAEIAFGQPDPSAIATAPQLKWIHISSSGFTRYDNPNFRSLMTERRIPVTNSASVYSEPCAVHALSFMLAQARNLPQGFQSRAANGTNEWNQLRHTSTILKGEKVLILGYGAIGRRLTELLAPFDMKITGFRRKPRGDEGVAMVTETDLWPVLKEADHVIDILPESAQTLHFFDETRFGAMKPGAVFYNIGRGKTVNKEALGQALRSGQLKSAWLDVTDPEPLPEDHPLLKLPNCFITPHTAGGHPDEALSLVRHFAGNFRRFLNQEPLQDRVI